MNTKEFNPSDVGVKNGNYFGFPFTPNEAEIVIISAPWDVTTSYKPGAHKAPEAIKEASVQLDFYDFDVAEAWTKKIATIPTDVEIEKLNKKTRPHAQKVINHLENGGTTDDKNIALSIKKVNWASEIVNQKIYSITKNWLSQNKKVVLTGGDHSTPLGFIKALSDFHPSFGILHIDAHADLRQNYEGFTYSHASIMFNVLQNNAIEKIVQVAIRDVSAPEMEMAANNPKIKIFSDNQLYTNTFNGISWHSQCLEIINCLPQKVYISFDIDGLDPSLCPNTGTPVPGGLNFNQACYLLKILADSGKEIIGCDVNEVSPGTTDWDANVGARILLKMINFLAKSKKS